MINSNFLIKTFVILLCLNCFNGVRSECSSSTDWECDNEECISDDRLCDGRVDCGDRSDEIAENCMQFFDACPEFAFRCAYGACVYGNASCNGVQDCADNSDELICVKKDDTDFQGACSDIEIQCLQSKECIDSILLCDGTRNCKDGSDESLEVCINYGCTSFGFQCGNGGCISKNARCNGKIECVDGSDEAWALCGTPRKKNDPTVVLPTPTPKPTPKPTAPTPTSPPFSRNCNIPNNVNLQNLEFKLHPRNETIQPGSYVEDFETVHIECKGNYALKGQSSLLCRDGTWDYDFPTCDGFCDGTLLNRLSIKTICISPRKYFECPKKIAPLTAIQVNCAFGYTREPPLKQDLLCRADGSFDQIPHKCKPTCGRIAPSSTALSKNGIEIKSSLAPWHVAIYEKTDDYVYICGGSIISPTIVISAAHCFWDTAVMILRDNTEYQIIAGQSSNNYTTEQSLYSQLIKVEQIHIPKEYEGQKGRHLYDIAFLKLETPFEYSETVAPICLPKQLRSTASGYVLSGKTGYINGYGPQNHLERLQMTTLSYHDCRDKSPLDSPVADDKFCIYNDQGGLVCRGDSGGEFFDTSIVDPQTYDRLYNLLGVISNTPTTKSACTRTGGDSYVAITNIYNVPQDFKDKLELARENDEKLF